MASFIFQRAGWSLQITRTSRNFAVTFTTALPRRSHHQTIASDASNNLRSSRRDLPRRRSQHNHLHSDFRATKLFQAQQARAATTATAPNDSVQQPPPASDRNQRAADEAIPTEDLTAGLSDKPIVLDESSRQVDWARSFHGLSTEAFSKEAAEALLAPIEQDDIEVKPDGIVYLPEIKYRRILNKAFGPGGWGLAPRGETIVTTKAVTREYALVALGRSVPARFKRMCMLALTLSPIGLFQLPGASKTTFLLRAFQLLSRAASRTLSCVAAKTLESQVNSGTRVSYGNSSQGMQKRSGWNINKHRSGGRYG